MDPRIFSAFADEMEKQALIERLVRLGATDIPKTPRLFMKKRSPAELQALQGSVTQLGQKHVADPIMRVAERGLQKLPAGRTQDTARSVAKTVAKDPVGAVATIPIPIPGAQPAYFAGKRLLERGIDKAFPIKGK
jgi:hypothetical protein